MPTPLTYPGVYIEEIPSGVRTITGVATSITAFIGSALKGPVNEAMTINSYADFERIFGGLWLDSTLGYAVRDFYLNGGSQAIVARLFHSKFASKEDRAKAETAAKAVADAAKNKPNGREAKAEADRIKADILNPANNKTQVEKDTATAVAADIGKLPDDAGSPAITAAADTAVRKAVQESRVKLTVGSMKLEAAYEGVWGVYLRARIDLDNISTPDLLI